MNTWRKVGCCLVAALAAFGAWAEVKWSYEGTTLAEVLPEGSSATAWAFTLNNGTLTAKTTGTNPELDLSCEALPDSAVIVTLGRQVFVNKTVLTKVILPEGLTTVGEQAFYGCNGLVDLTMPSTVTSIGNNAFYGCSSLKDFTWPEGLTSIGGTAFRGCSKLTHVVLPDTLTTIGGEAFRDCSSLTTVTPLVPRSVTSLGAGAFKNDGKLEGEFEYGFAVNESGAPVMVTLGTDTLQSDAKLTAVRFGSGVTSIANNFFQLCSSVGYLELGSNLTDVASLATCLKNNTALTNVVFLTDKTITFPNQTFRGCTSVREISFNGMFEYTQNSSVDSYDPFYGWSNLQCRFIVPGDSAAWAAFIADPAKVTPWESDGISQADRDAYFARYGQDAKTPVGISVGVKNGLRRTYIVKTDAEIAGYPLTVTTSAARFATVTCLPELPPSGFYESGAEVTVTVNVADGATFRGWSGSVPAGQEKSTSLTITMDEAKSLYACVTSDEFLYENGYLVDGEFQIAATRTISGSVTNFSLTSVKVTPNPLVDSYDFTKPIRGGGSIVSMGSNLLNGNSIVRHVKLPETLTAIGSQAFRDCANLISVTPLVPRSVISIGGSAFKDCGKLEGEFKHGFAVNASGVPIPVTLETDVLLGAGKIKSVRFGPGVTSIANNYLYGCSSVGYLELGSNLTGVASLNTCLENNTSLTNVVLLTDKTITFPNRTFRGCTNLREVSFNGWFEYTQDSTTDAYNPFYGWSNLQCRFFIPKDNPQWTELLSDPVRFTRWRRCAKADREAYFARYGADAVRPTGITVAVKNGLPKTYVIGPKTGMILFVR